MEEKFSVWQFFQDDTHECVRSRVSAEEAMEVFRHYTDNVATRLGIIKRVIIVDDGDFTNAEWVHGEGVIFPLPTDASASSPERERDDKSST